MLTNIQALQATGQATNVASTSPKITPGEAQNKFASSLKGAIDQLNASQVASDVKTQALVNGEIDDLHDVMITAQKASITLNTAIEVQKKAVDAYKEMMRMQV
ncbi:flagellar hook-basal body complex protein FliE [Paraliobacillus ryukyuensis]|uniref:Flagellar hook-basal body complex protein FliE n=1 Tax=Paraliobacillus ryukyuensis TaxID=200904 RepID=A0A366EHF5_9BACI|nr:flagellar hook-basal body complex protein FliE [Paraliobacillus ryukyuensis]RBP01804.1 flagellar hook-basal body complex protein FliE [Paraliobacillus ryukyuensis]